MKIYDLTIREFTGILLLAMLDTWRELPFLWGFIIGVAAGMFLV